MVSHPLRILVRGDENALGFLPADPGTSRHHAEESDQPNAWLHTRHPRDTAEYIGHPRARNAMDRRQFVGLTGASANRLAPRTARRGHDRMPTVALAKAGPPNRHANGAAKALMKVGTQHGDSDAILRVLAGFGVNHICSLSALARSMDDAWSVESLTRCGSASSRSASRSTWCRCRSARARSRAARTRRSCSARSRARPADRRHLPDDPQYARAPGIPSVKYNLTLHRRSRTAPTPGRGGAQLQHVRL